MNTATRKTPDWLVQANAEALRRFEAVDWQNGKWYAIHDTRESGPEGARMFKCEIADGEIFLIADQCDYDRRGGHAPDVYEARGYVTSCAVVVAL